MSGVQRTPTQAEELAHRNYGVPYPNPVDLLVELVTARSGAGPVAISDRDIAQRLRLKTTDDALRLVAIAAAAGRVIEHRDGDRRMLAIPWEMPGRDPVASIRAAVPGSLTATGASDPVVPPPEPPAAPHTPKEPEMTERKARGPQPPRNLENAVNMKFTPEWHARFRARAEATGIPITQVVRDAAMTGFEIAVDGVVADPAPVSARYPAIADIDNLRVPIALIRAAQDAGITLRALTEEVIAAGWASYRQAQAGGGA